MSLRALDGDGTSSGAEAPQLTAEGPDERLRLLQAGDRKAISDAVRELFPTIRNWLHRLLGPSADLDDATQDALTEFAKALPRFEGRSSLKTLAHRITVRVAYRYFRKSSDKSLELVPPPPDKVDPESRVMGREALKRLYRCLDRMPKKRRVAFVLCAIEGLSPAEAAKIEGVSAVAMRSRLMHARAEISRRLSADPYVNAFVERSP
ncbi:MAG: RNA polymerase sigma factor [Myxococcota bacterium]